MKRPAQGFRLSLERKNVWRDVRQELESSFRIYNNTKLLYNNASMKCPLCPGADGICEHCELPATSIAIEVHDEDSGEVEVMSLTELLALNSKPA